MRNEIINTMEMMSIAYINDEELAMLFDKFTLEYSNILEFRYSDKDGELVRVSIYGDTGYQIGIFRLLSHESTLFKVYDNDDDISTILDIANTAITDGADYIEYYVPNQK